MADSKPVVSPDGTIDPQLVERYVAEYLNGLRCFVCHERRFSGQCSCKRDARHRREVSELDEWFDKVALTANASTRRFAGRAYLGAHRRSCLRAGLRGRVDPNTGENAMMVAAAKARAKVGMKPRPSTGQTIPGDEFPV